MKNCRDLFVEPYCDTVYPWYVNSYIPKNVRIKTWNILVGKVGGIVFARYCDAITQELKRQSI